MSTNAVTVTSQATADALAAALAGQLQQNRWTVLDRTGDDRAVRFRTRKTLFSWELDGQAQITAGPQGSELHVWMETAANRPAALLDGAKNQRAARAFADQVLARATG